MLQRIIKELPGFNCGNCQYKDCEEFANALLEKRTDLTQCNVLQQERFKSSFLKINKILLETSIHTDECYTGVIDEYEADIILDPLPGEKSCREVLSPFTNMPLSKGDFIEYRPLGCPVVHYAKIIDKNYNLITVHIVGPCKRIDRNFDYKEIGVCSVIAFEGTYHGKNIKVGETVRFLPNHCMMQKVHSGVVVNIESNKVLLEGIDLKVWHPSLNV